jgi:RimJ/RimL family protein N-acetyltransferase
MLETKRLLIRPFLPADADTIYDLAYANLEVRKCWSGWKGGIEEFRERYKTDKLYTCVGAGDFHYNALVRKEDGVLMGLMGFQNHANDDMNWLLMPDGSRNVGHIPGVLDVELTYALGKDYWDQGYATEAGVALIDYGFSKLGIDRIVNAISPQNVRSRNLMLRLGFTFLDNGNPEDMIGMLENPGGRARQSAS